MKTRITTRLSRILVTALVVCMIATLLLPATVLAANDAVNDAKHGVLQVNLVYTDETNKNISIASGTGFLINDNTVISAHHVANLSDEELVAFAEMVGKTVAEFQSRLSVTVTVSRDVTIPANVITESFDMDFSVLRLSSSLQGKTALKIRSSASAKQAEDVYAIGFPDISANLQTYNTYTSNDATITQGIINKIGVGINLYSGANTDYIQTSCNLDYGNSGGPMVDENGYVVGICQGIIGDEVTEYYNAVAIDQVTQVLDALGIVYSKAGDEPAPVVTEAPVVVTEPVVVPEESTATIAPTEPEVTLPPIEPPIDPEEPINMTLILIIAAVAVVIIVVVIIIIVASGSKKSAPAPQPVSAAPIRPAAPVTPANPGFTPAAPTYPVQGAGETTVLGGSAGETTVLARNAVNGGTLIRKRTGESITINAEQFIIGRERKGVNYCISDNSSISRTHVKLSIRGGVTYLADMGAANGTFVNGVKVLARQEVALKNGDKITLADEDLEYKN